MKGFSATILGFAGLAASAPALSHSWTLTNPEIRQICHTEMLALPAYEIGVLRDLAARSQTAELRDRFNSRADDVATHGLDSAEMREILDVNSWLMAREAASYPTDAKFFRSMVAELKGSPRGPDNREDAWRLCYNQALLADVERHAVNSGHNKKHGAKH